MADIGPISRPTPPAGITGTGAATVKKPALPTGSSLASSNESGRTASTSGNSGRGDYRSQSSSLLGASSPSSSPALGMSSLGSADSRLTGPASTLSSGPSSSARAGSLSQLPSQPTIDINRPATSPAGAATPYGTASSPPFAALNASSAQPTQTSLLAGSPTGLPPPGAPLPDASPRTPLAATTAEATLPNGFARLEPITQQRSAVIEGGNKFIQDGLSKLPKGLSPDQLAAHTDQLGFLFDYGLANPPKHDPPPDGGSAGF